MNVIRLFNQAITLRFTNAAVISTLLLFTVLLLVLIYSLFSGSYTLSIQDILDSLWHQSTTDEQASLIIWEFRLPRSLVAMGSGALFALSGAILQNMTRNPLADPSLVGISHGAALAVVTLTVLFPAYIDAWREIAAFIGALFIAMVIQYLRGNGHPLKFILLGIGVVAFISAIISTLITYGDFQSAMSALAWLSGSTHATSWKDVILLMSTLAIFSVLSIYQSKNMAAIRLGDDVAIGLGVSIHKAMKLQLFISVASAATATAVVGPVGFVGLLAPHLARKILNTSTTNHLVLTALVGAILVLAADIIGRTAFAPTQLAAGLVTSLIGAPLFAYLLIKKSS
jgi:iron complex transport system permease protein